MEQVDRFGNARTIIHLSFTEGGVERVACMPGMTELHTTPYHQLCLRSNDPRAINCPQCQQTPTYRGHPDAPKR